MNRKEASYLSILFISLLIIASIATYQLAYSGWTGNLQDQGRGIEDEKPYSYLISSNGTYTVAYNSSGFEEFGSTNGLTVLQTAVDNTENGTVFIKPPFVTEGTLIITHRHGLTIDSGLINKFYSPLSDQLLYIKQITLNSSSGLVENIWLKGLYIRTLHLYGDNTSYGISNVCVDNCRIDVYTSSDKGLVLENGYGEGSSPWIEKVFFYNTHFASHSVPSGNYGVVTWIGGGLGWINFIDCSWSVYCDDAVFMYSLSGINMEAEAFVVSSISGYDNVTFIYISEDAGGGGLTNAKFTSGTFEVSSNITIIRYEDRASGEGRCSASFDQTQFFVWGSTNRLTLLNNLNTHWVTTIPNVVKFSDCLSRGFYGSIEAGTWNDGTHFKVECDIASYTFTENRGSTIFNNNSSVTFNHGLYSTPTGVWTSFNCTGWGSWFWNGTSTQLTIQTENNVNATCYWFTEYRP